MKYWIITDTHFNHPNIIEYCNRPQNSDELLRENILNHVKKNDILIHLGDVCMGNDKENNNWFEGLGTKNILIKGNHDKKSYRWYMQNGWDLCVYRLDLKMFGKHIAFTHTPVGWDGYFDLNIHGHLHNANYKRYETDFIKKTINGYHKLLAVEYTDYKPVLLRDFIEK